MKHGTPFKKRDQLSSWRCAFLNSLSLAHSFLKRLRDLGEGAVEHDVAHHVKAKRKHVPCGCRCDLRPQETPARDMAHPYIPARTRNVTRLKCQGCFQAGVHVSSKSQVCHQRSCQFDNSTHARLLAVILTSLRLLNCVL